MMENDPYYRPDPRKAQPERPMPPRNDYDYGQEGSPRQQAPFRPVPQGVDDRPYYGASQAMGSDPYAGTPDQGGYAPDYNQSYMPPYQEMGRRPRQQRRPGRGAQGNGGMPLLLQQTFNDFRCVFTALFSKNPASAFQYNISTLTLSVLLVLSILIFGLASAVYSTRTVSAFLGSVLQGLNEVLPGGLTDEMPGDTGFGSFFLSGMLGQLVYLIVMLAWGYVVGFLAPGSRNTSLRYLKTLALSTLPQTCILIFAMIGCLISVPLGQMLIIGSAFFFVHFYAHAFQESGSPQRVSQFWYFAVAFLLTAMLYAWMPGLHVIVL